MSDHATMIWKEIQERAREALQALQPYVGWYSARWDINCGVDFVGSDALYDDAVVAGTSQYLGDFCRESCSRTDAFETVVWESAHWLQALKAIANCGSPEEALALPFELPDRRLLLNWAEEQRAVYAAIRQGGPDSDPETILHDMFVNKHQEVVDSAIGSCGGHLEEPPYAMSEEEYDGYYQVWDRVTCGPR